MPSYAPVTHVYAVTPSDTVNLPQTVRAIRVAGAGNVVITTSLGQKATLAFTAGETRWIFATRIWSTGTTATTIEAMV